MARLNGSSVGDYITFGAPTDLYPVQATDEPDVIRTFGGDDYVNAGGARDHVELGTGNDGALGGEGHLEMAADKGQGLGAGHSALSAARVSA